jgi:hypothetical protein
MVLLPYADQGLNSPDGPSFELVEITYGSQDVRRVRALLAARFEQASGFEL